MGFFLSKERVVLGVIHPYMYAVALCSAFCSTLAAFYAYGRSGKPSVIPWMGFQASIFLLALCELFLAFSPYLSQMLPIAGTVFELSSLMLLSLSRAAFFLSVKGFRSRFFAHTGIGTSAYVLIASVDFALLVGSYIFGCDFELPFFLSCLLLFAIGVKMDLFRVGDVALRLYLNVFLLVTLLSFLFVPLDLLFLPYFYLLRIWSPSCLSR